MTEDKNTLNQHQGWSVHIADSVMQRRFILGKKWAYEWGVVLRGLHEVWQRTDDTVYFDYIKSNIDYFVAPDGSIRTYRLEDYNLDMINTGKLLFPLYRVTGHSRYKMAIQTLVQQLKQQPRTAEGGFWHKKIYPHQMWLDGIYMACPFYAQYASMFDEPHIFDDVAHQIKLIVEKTCDPATELLYHGWDSSGRQRWAHPETGRSPHFWGRAIGWFVMAIPDVLDFFPQDHPAHDELVTIFRNVIMALLKVQDTQSGLWYQVLDRGNNGGNYVEASASAMFIYAIAKGVRRGYLDDAVLPHAERAFEEIIHQFIEVDEHGLVNVNRICSVAGLGGEPYRDGSFEYYVNEPIVTNDDKGVGAFILAAAELEAVSEKAFYNEQ